MTEMTAKAYRAQRNLRIHSPWKKRFGVHSASAAKNQRRETTPPDEVGTDIENRRPEKCGSDLFNAGYRPVGGPVPRLGFLRKRLAGLVPDADCGRRTCSGRRPGSCRRPGS